MSKEWRCFHCDDVFTDEELARDHFAIEGIPPMCVDPLTKDEKARMVVVRKLESELVKWRAENEQLDHEAGCYHAYQAELGRYFGTCAGFPVKTTHQAFLVYEAMIGAKEAAESQVAALTASLASVTKERDRISCIRKRLEVILKQKENDSFELVNRLASIAGLREPALGGAAAAQMCWAQVTQQQRRAESAEASLAELRKQVVDAAEDLEEGHEATALARLHTAIASPPSPAPKPCDHASECYHKPHCDSGSFDAPAADTAKPSPEKL